MQKINTGLHKPVIFLNGTKYKLDKAYTFINGQKYEVWGEGGVQVDFISSTNINGTVFTVGEDWAAASSSSNILRLDISNLNNPTQIQSVNWGNVVQHNSFLSSSSNSVFFTTLNSHTHHKLLVTPTGSISVDKTLTSSSDATIIRGFTNDYVFGTKSLSQYVTNQTGHGTGRFVHYGDNYYWNTSLRYSTGAYPSPQSYYISGGLQLDANNIVANILNNGFNKAAYSGLTKIRDNYLEAAGLLDGNIICGLKSGTGSLGSAYHNAFVLTDKISFAELAVFPTDYDTVRCKHIFLGKIGTYYYVLRLPAYMGQTEEVKLFVLNEADLSVAYEKVLPNDPFDENSGALTFWQNSNVFPQISNTGFLSLAGLSSAGIRFARFSALI